MEATTDINDWLIFGVVLKLDIAKVQKVVAQQENPHLDIIRLWIDSGTASWASLVSALRNNLVDKPKIAKQIATEHPNPS